MSNPEEIPAALRGPAAPPAQAMYTPPSPGWNGEPCEARRITAVIADPGTFPQYWARGFVGTRRKVVEVTYGGSTFYLDDEGDFGWIKVTSGGPPHLAHSNITIDPDTIQPSDDATCRVMETRTCPESYNGPCGTRPCARFESDDPTPWLAPSETPAPDAVKTLGTVPWTDGTADLYLHGQLRPAPAARHEEDTPSAEEQLALLRQAVLDIDAHATPIGQADPNDPDAGPHHYVVTPGALHRALGKVGHTAPACRAEVALARFHEGEEPVTDPAVQCTPGQFIWQWNRATQAERLDVAARWTENAARASKCFMGGHEMRLEQAGQAWAALSRAKEVAAEMDRRDGMAHWVRTLEEALRLTPPATES